MSTSAPFITRDELEEHRSDALARMGAVNGGSDVTIRRRNGTATVDGMEVPAWLTVAANVPFRLSAGSASLSTPGATRRAVVGNVEVNLALRTGHLPVGTDVRDDDFLELTAGENAGLVFRVVAGTGQDQATARRVPLLEVQRPEEWP